MQQKLKCYLGRPEDGDPEDGASVCFAHNARQAKRLMWNEDELSTWCDGDYFSASVTRFYEGDKFLDPNANKPYCVDDNKTLRQLGFWVEGDKRCTSCGLCEMDGEFPVCGDCMQCVECGHGGGCYANGESDD